MPLLEVQGSPLRAVVSLLSQALFLTPTQAQCWYPHMCLALSANAGGLPAVPCPVLTAT